MVSPAFGQAFGRFGYATSWSIPGLVLTKDGVRTEHPAADLFRFPSPLKQWKAIATTDMSQTVNTGDFAGSPDKLRQDLTSPGFIAHFPKGFRFAIRSTGGPLLTWAEDGSMEANTGYATPASSWVVVSFRDGQPPLLMSFVGKQASVRLTGRSGDWTLASDGEFEGWVRFSAPLGVRPFPTNSVADLAKLAKTCEDGIALGASNPPVMTGVKVTDEGAGILAEWSFDRPGAIVPYPVFLSALGGYSLQVSSKTKRLDMPTSQGPTFITDEPKLSVHFVSRRIPTGRAVLLGIPTMEGIGTASYLDYASVTELAVANLVSTLEKGSRDLAQSTVSEFLSECAYSAEPNTGQRLPYDGEGNGLDLAAAHAFLMQSTLTTAKATSEPNALLTSVNWRRDWLTWQIACADPARRRRTAALAALAASVSPEPERRLDGALLQAGLAAERGLGIWLQRTQGGPAPGKLLEPMDDLREDVFGKDDYRRKAGFGKSITSELRAFGDIAVSLAADSAGKKTLRWAASDTHTLTITLAAAYPIEVVPGKNVVDVQVSQGLGFTIMRAKPRDAGICEAEVKFPEWASPLPAWLSPPRYTEVIR